MDNLTHTLTGIAISQTGLNRKTRFATLTLILAANAPDVDVLAGLKGSIAYLKYHRGIAHSFVGIVALAGPSLCHECAYVAISHQLLLRSREEQFSARNRTSPGRRGCIVRQ